MSGQIPLDPETGQVLEADVAVQVARLPQNVAVEIDVIAEVVGAS